MATIRLSSLDVAGLRFAFSPLWECVAAFCVWREPNRVALHRPWVQTVHTALLKRDWSALDMVLMAPSQMVPDFVAPPPTRAFATFEEELSVLQQTSHKLVRAEILRAHAPIPDDSTIQALRHTASLISAVASSLRFFWQHAVEPIWPRISARLEAEVSYRSRLLAFEGGAAVLRGLHPTLHFAGDHRGGTLSVDSNDRHSRSASGRGVLLVPSVFAFPRVFAVTRSPWRPTVAYPARGIESVWRRSRAPGRDTRMAATLGGTRARLLTRLVLPQTTVELAAALELNASTVSEHLAVLSGAGVLTRSRVGRRVFYSLSDSGIALTESFRK